MKGNFIKKFHLLFVQNSFEEFEQEMVSQFILYFGNLLPLQYSYTDWLVSKLRPIRRQKICSSALNSDYIQSELTSDPKKLILFLQFIHYAKDSDFKVESLGEINYRVVTFQLNDFLQLQNQSINSYQFKKAKVFFKELRTDMLLTSFTEKYFQSLVAVPIVKFEKVDKFLIVKVWLVEELFLYNYPFSDFSLK